MAGTNAKTNMFQYEFIYQWRPRILLFKVIDQLD